MSQELIGKIQSNLNCSCRLASSLLKQYNRNKSNEIDSQTFDNLVEFCCLCICCVECLMQLGLTGDIRQKNIQETQVTITREFYSEEFPKEIFA